MRSKYLVLPAILAILAACSEPSGNTTAPPSPKPTSSPVSMPTADPAATPVAKPKDGDYNAKGVVTKINLEAGSIEIDHEEIKDLMPKMVMEFFVSEKKMLDGLKVGDRVEFVLTYKDPTETITKIKKAP
jgi:Cu(I)/Ag(I) efflux system membrane protein CusA/SilA